MTRCAWIARCTNGATHTTYTGPSAGTIPACDTCHTPAEDDTMGTHIPHTAPDVQDYSRSRYSDVIAEHADRIVLDGFGEDAIYGADGCVAFDLVNTGAECAGLVILRRSDAGWCDTETAEHDGAEPTADVHGHYGAARVRCMWDALTAEYAAEDDGAE